MTTRHAAPDSATRARTAIDVREVSLLFGRSSVLDGVSLQAHHGRIFGLIGPNGAGKTSLLKIVVGLLEPTDGSVVVDRRRLGFVPEHLGFVEHATGPDNLRWLGRLRGSDVSTPRLEHLLSEVGLLGIDGLAVAKYSQGMRRRLGIAQMLVDEPDIVVLDEPQNGLDPDGVAWLRGLLVSMASSGAAVVVSSHLLGELETNADDVAVLRDGRCVLEGGLDDLLRVGRHVRLRVDPDRIDVVEQYCDIVEHRPGDGDLIIRTDRSDERLLRELAAADVGLVAFSPVSRRLEDLYAATGPRQ